MAGRELAFNNLDDIERWGDANEEKVVIVSQQRSVFSLILFIIDLKNSV